MKKAFVFLFLAIIGTGQSVYGQKGEEKLVIEAFENYKAAILHDKGEEAVKFIDSRTIRYYDDMLELIKFADSAKIVTLPFADKFMVFSVRNLTPKKDILNFSGKTLFIYAIKRGMVGKNSVANNSIGEVTIYEDFAKGQLMVNGQETPVYLHFYKEDKQWKINLTTILSLSVVVFKQMIHESGMEENEYLFLLLEMATGKKPASNIWKPIVK